MDETAAYERSYGSRGGDVKLVQLPPRRPRNREVLANGELLRRAFLDRLQQRQPEQAETAQQEGDQPAEAEEAAE